METRMANTLNLNTKVAAETKLNFLLAAVQRDGDLTALLAYADWLEDNGSDKRAAQVRKRAYHYAELKGRTVCRETWLVWHARYELGLIADGLVGGTHWKRFTYLGNYSADGRMISEDGSLERQLDLGYVLTLRRSSKRQTKLGRIIEGLGYQVTWID
jgi:uncharacterized protein (TIGR02996 family)